MPTHNPASTRTVISTNIRRQGHGGSAGSPASTRRANTNNAQPEAGSKPSRKQPPAHAGGHLASDLPPPSAHDQQLIQQAQARTVFPALLAEGDQLTRHGHYTAATALYSRALEILPTDAIALAARARCHVLRGDQISALADANAALAADPDSWKALHVKADALFDNGDFENALLCCHRGVQLRPDLDEFRGGIVRATEAICSAVAGIDPERLRAQRAAEIELDGKNASAAGEVASRPVRKHRQHAPQQHQRHHGHHPGAVGRTLSSTSLKRPVPATAPRASTASAPSPGMLRSASTVASAQSPRHDTSHSPSSRPASASTPRAVLERNLLDELYDDHAFLLALAADTSLADAADGSVAALIDEGCRFMQGRLDYWRVRNPSCRPLSARERGTRIGSASRPTSASAGRPGAATPVRRTRLLIL
ncbi:Tetratricopeptide repeat protein 25 [Geranomyces variabilis]|uniref:Outer dynein arm-docking complex subunit 4 n=1 Tax=Geranomyces variabilis TaxID=109894 RepID=A0AAD5XQD0_9FUNG|nr:Tetratricopeptide repeat protein 25 [Geranomyces variabilis]